jgi:ATP-dependent RNA helicase DeaD
LLEQWLAESGLPLIDIAAALACMSQGTTPLLLNAKTAVPEPTYVPPGNTPRPREERGRAGHLRPDPETLGHESRRNAGPDHVPPRDGRAGHASSGHASPGRANPGRVSPGRVRPSAAHMETYRIEVGAEQGIKPGNIVGAIANEAGIEGVRIGRVDIRENHSYVDLPEGMPRDIFSKLQKLRVAGRELHISKAAEKAPKPARAPLSRFPKKHEERSMSKGMERKKEQKKKPTKTLEEKRAAKKEKKAARG